MNRSDMERRISKPPLDAPLSLLAGYWLEARCPCKLTYLPLLQLSKRACPNVRLGELLPRLKCEKCGERPSELALVDDPGAGAPGSGSAPQMRIPLEAATR